MFQSLGQYDQAKELSRGSTCHHEYKLGDKRGEAADYGNLGTVFQSLGQYDKAKEYHEKALAITNTN